MNDLESMSSEELWEAIEHNARYAQSHMDWIRYLDNVKVLSAVLGARIQRFQHEMRIEQLLGDRRLTEKAETSSKVEVTQ